MKLSERDAAIEKAANEIADKMYEVRDNLIQRKAQELYALLGADNRSKCKRIDYALSSLVRSRFE